MPDTPQPDAGASPTPEPDKPAAPAAPQFVPVDDFKNFQSTMMQTVEAMHAGIQAINASLAARNEPARSAAPSAPAITEDAYAKALVEGDVSTIAAYVRQEKARSEERLDRFKTEHVDPIRQTGLGSIEGIVSELSSGKLAYFKRFEKEIREKVAGLPTEQRIHPRVWEIAHNAVVGEHIPTLLAEQKEQILRAAPAAGTQTPGDAGTGRVKDDKNRVPTVKELLGDDAVASLESRGLTPDEFAKRLGRKNWAEYAKLITKQREEATSNA